MNNNMSSYNFSKREEYLRFLSNLRIGVEGEQSTIYFDDKRGKAIKTFSLENGKMNGRRMEAKLRELMKFKSIFPTIALPEMIIKCEGKCFGYVMPMLPKSIELRKVQGYMRNQRVDLKEVLEITCELARLVKQLHSMGIVIGDFHPGQFMTKHGKIYVCDTDTWGISNQRARFEAEKVGRPEYVDPMARDFHTDEFVIAKYSKESDWFSLAVMAFEMLTGSNPYDGGYPLVKRFDRSLRALNRISILGNHNLNLPSNFKLSHVAWMSEELQADFLRIFEGNERFNILPSLEKQAKNLKLCGNNHYYNASRYSECPCCSSQQESKALESFRNYKVNAMSYSKAEVFPKETTRKIVDFFTFLDYDGNAVHLQDAGNVEKVRIKSETEGVYFTRGKFIVELNRVTMKDVLSKEFGTLYGAYSFFDKMRQRSNTTDPANRLEILNENGEKLYSTIISKLRSKMKVAGNHLFFVDAEEKLMHIHMAEGNRIEKNRLNIEGQFIYEINELGQCCVWTIDDAGNSKVFVDGKLCIQLTGEIPRNIKYDSVSRSWCVIAKSLKGGYNTYVIEENNMVYQKFRYFSYAGLNLKNSIFFNSMLVIPADGRIVFLRSGEKVETSRVFERNLEICNNNSKILIKYNLHDKVNYFYVQNSDQVYKFVLS